MAAQYITNTCRSCKAEIIWAVTPEGKAQPIDAYPTRGGNVLLTDPRPGITPIATVIKDPTDDTLSDIPTLRTSHFATCPEAKIWRKRG